MTDAELRADFWASWLVALDAMREKLKENPQPTVRETVGLGAQNDQALNRSKDLPRGDSKGQARS